MILATDTRLPATSIRAVRSVLPGRDLPGAVLPNERLAELMREVREELERRPAGRKVPPCTPEFAEDRVGIRVRRVLDDELSARDLAWAAARRVLIEAAIPLEDVRVIVVTTVTPDKVVPALATTVAGRLGLAHSVTAFDLTLGCNGFLAGLDVATRLLAPWPEGSVALVVGAETMTRVLDASDRTTCPIFGDGAGAVALVRTAEPGLLPVQVTTLGECGPRIEIRPAANADEPLYRIASRCGDAYVREERVSRHVVAMEGRRVFRDMVRTVPALVRDYLAAHCVGTDEVDRFVFHQANARLIEAIASAPELDLAPDKVLTNIADVGNTTSASIPILLSEASERGELRAGDRVVLVGFGTGYSVGITMVSWT